MPAISPIHTTSTCSESVEGHQNSQQRGDVGQDTEDWGTGRNELEVHVYEPETRATGEYTRRVATARSAFHIEFEGL